MGGESEAAWRALLDDLVKRGLRTPELAIVDGAAGLEKALAALWNHVPVQRCSVHKHRNLLAHAPERLHEEISNDYKDMIYAGSKPEIETKRKAFIRKWRLKCHAVADSLEEELTIAALSMVIQRQKPPPGLIHHSDRGSQYAAAGYRKVLGAAGRGAASMA